MCPSKSRLDSSRISTRARSSGSSTWSTLFRNTRPWSGSARPVGEQDVLLGYTSSRAVGGGHDEDRPVHPAPRMFFDRDRRGPGNRGAGAVVQRLFVLILDVGTGGGHAALALLGALSMFA